MAVGSGILVCAGHLRLDSPSMTEIPEHLLARSRARRGEAAQAPAAGGEVEVAAGAATPATATERTPATQAAAAPPPPPPPPPDPPHVRAYKERPKIPYWVMPVLLLLPVWGFIYANTMTTPTATAEGPLAQGAALYQSAGCVACHGSNGEGGVGPSFQDGAVLKTWPSFKDHIRWVHLGSAGWPGNTYGATNKPKKGGMPAFGTANGGSLTDLEIALVVRYEREVLAGGPPEEELVAITEGTEPPLNAEGKASG